MNRIPSFAALGVELAMLCGRSNLAAREQAMLSRLTAVSTDAGTSAAGLERLATAMAGRSGCVESNLGDSVSVCL